MIKTYPMAFVTAPGIIEFREKQAPELGDHDVLIQVKAAAICGSDLHIFKGMHPMAALPVAIGHEAAGQIIETGASVTRVSVGDRVTIEPVIACGKCYYCVRGNYHLCQNISFQYREGQGAFAPYFTVHEDRAFKLPDGLSYEEGALIEPLSVALHAVKKSELHLGQTCAVFGAGAIGLLVAGLASRVSGGRVFVSDINPFRLQTGSQSCCRISQDDDYFYLLCRMDGWTDASFDSQDIFMFVTRCSNMLETDHQAATAPRCGWYRWKDRGCSMLLMGKRLAPSKPVQLFWRCTAAEGETITTNRMPK